MTTAECRRGLRSEEQRGSKWELFPPSESLLVALERELEEVEDNSRQTRHSI